jgi:pyruvate/2-oxoglutarate dehydrogenase complex dihydrolipoamide acyltransferase (E2) component
MTSTTLRIPKAAVSMQEGVLAAWLVDDRQSVVEGQPIYTLEIEKSTMDVEAPASGVLQQIGTAGVTYKVGEIIGEIGMPESTQSPAVAGPIDAGSIYHSGYVVADIHAAIRHWVRLAGAGPFVIFEDFEFVNPNYRGAPVGPKVTLAFAYSGDSCIELIQPQEAGPSIYTETPGSAHHIGIGVENLEASVQAYASAGIECAFRAAFPFGGGCAYLDTRSTIGVFTELVERGAVVNEMIRQMQVAHRNWNRRDLTFTLG